MIKRLFDLVIASMAVVALLPVLLLVALAVRLVLGTPVLFRQWRPGLHMAPFVLYKFRTMTNHMGPDGTLLPDAARLTRLGRLLRETSLDELPELINVLKGDMSLVGPRPLLMEYRDRYTPEQRRRHDVLPGMTGWAQVHGRNSLTWDEKFQLDCWYCEHRSIWLDCRILLSTVALLVTRQGIHHPGHVTMAPFQGSSVPTEGRS